MSEKMVVCGIEFALVRPRLHIWAAQGTGRLQRVPGCAQPEHEWEAILDVGCVGTGQTAEQALWAALYSLEADVERRKERLKRDTAFAKSLRIKMQRGGA